LIEAFALDFEMHGTDAIEKVRGEKPHEYLRIAASLVPKHFEIEDGRQPFALIPAEIESPEKWEASVAHLNGGTEKRETDGDPKH
jgi:hypothetical protein